jgi:peptidoglycan/LPS O-acetylase OafA/YrhL
MPLLGPLWSLGVEEQFYIFWPWVMRDVRNILKFTFIFTVAFIVIRVFFRFLDYKYGYSLPYLIIHVTRFDCMTIGALGAILMQQQNRLFMNISTHVITQILSWLVLVLLTFNKYHIASVVDQEIMSAVTVFLIINLSFNPKTLVNMENVFFDFLGRISYGIYMYHILAIFYSAVLVNQMTMEGNLKYAVIYTGVPALTILVAWLSYRYFETPFLRKKRKYSVIHSAPSITSET